MRKLLGYCCHLASVRLHWEAVRLLPVHGREWWSSEPTIQRFDDDSEDSSYDLALSHVAPRLADALDVVRDKIQHARWLAGVVGLGRMVDKK